MNDEKDSPLTLLVKLTCKLMQYCALKCLSGKGAFCMVCFYGELLVCWSLHLVVGVCFLMVSSVDFYLILV